MEVAKGRTSAVVETVVGDLPHPRHRATLSEPRFAEIREHVWSTLMDEARAAELAAAQAAELAAAE